ncbi:MAG: hypothetical protein JRN15_19095 [Nitrososphaerota archaeon]|nr:hypothetical protein [Nitrososphaerota archaeon]
MPVKPSDDDLDSSSKVKITRRKLAGRQKYCPQCFSELNRGSELSGWLVPDYYVCEKCGYSGHVALERSSETTD